jgi:putative tricarboxylic transport membrane protein
MMVKINAKDLASGLFFILFGLAYGGMAWTGLPIGTALNMGPGYLPIVLGLILVCLGGIVAIRSFVVPQETPFGKVPWRGVVILSLSTIVFAAFIDDLGMLPGVFLSTVISALASPKSRFLNSVVIGVCIAVFCTLIFDFGVRVPIPVIGPAFGHLGF